MSYRQTRFEFKMNFGGISYIAQGPWQGPKVVDKCSQRMNCLLIKASYMFIPIAQCIYQDNWSRSLLSVWPTLLSTAALLRWPNATRTPWSWSRPGRNDWCKHASSHPCWQAISTWLGSAEPSCSHCTVCALSPTALADLHRTHTDSLDQPWGLTHGLARQSHLGSHYTLIQCLRDPNAMVCCVLGSLEPVWSQTTRTERWEFQYSHGTGTSSPSRKKQVEE